MTDCDGAEAGAEAAGQEEPLPDPLSPGRVRPASAAAPAAAASPALVDIDAEWHRLIASVLARSDSYQAASAQAVSVTDAVRERASTLTASLALAGSLPGGKPGGDAAPAAFVRFLRGAMETAWARGQRPLALRLAVLLVQAPSCLAEPAIAYPHAWLEVSAALDVLQALVLSRAAALGPSLGDDTCRAWLRRAASVPELLPRVYLSSALLPLVARVSRSGLPAAAGELALALRGVGSPLAAAFARAFLVRCACAASRSAGEVAALRLALAGSAGDHAAVMLDFAERRATALWTAHGVTLREFRDLQAPALLFCEGSLAPPLPPHGPE